MLCLHWLHIIPRLEFTSAICRHSVIIGGYRCLTCRRMIWAMSNESYALVERVFVCLVCASVLYVQCLRIWVWAVLGMSGN